MAFKSLLTATMAASSLLASSTFAVDLGSKTNLAVYYGQGPYQERLAHFCQKSSLDIIPISFVHIFPDQGAGGYPGSNFGNQCSSEVYENEDGVPTELYKDCHQIAEDIPICQAAGKTILLSLGGATSRYKLDSSKSARDFADFLWGAFGPKTASWGDKPRPFGDAVIDGFDFDIEHNGNFGYATMVNRLRSLYREDSGKRYYISAAPQCPPDDKQLAVPIMTSYFDFIFVQFYNTYSCSARSWVTNPRRSDFSFDDWVKVIKRSPNPSARIYIGLAASVNATYDDTYYLSPLEVQPLAATFMIKHPKNFGGIMLWEATYSENNQINGKSYADHMKRILYELSPPPTVSTSKISSTTSKASSTWTTWTRTNTQTYPASSEPPYPTGTSTVDPTNTGTYPASSEPPYPTGTSTVDPTNTGTYPASSEPPYPTGTSTVDPTNTGTYPASSEPPYPTGTSTVDPTNTGTYPASSEPPYPTGTSTVDPTNTGSYPASSEPPYPTGTSTVDPTNTGTYPASSEPPYPTGTSTVDPTNTGTYPASSEPPYPTGTSTVDPTNTGSYPASSEPPYPTGTETVDPTAYPTDAYPTDAYPTDTYPTDIYPTDAYPTDTYPTDIYPTDAYPTDTYPTDTYPTDAYPTDNPTGTNPTDVYPTDVYPTDVYPTDAYPTDTYPTDVYPTDVYPTDAYPTDTYPTDVYPTDVYPTDTETAQPTGTETDTYPTDAYPTDVYPTGAYPTDVYPTDAYPTGAYPTDTETAQPTGTETDTYPTDAYPTDVYPTGAYPTDVYPTDAYPTDTETVPPYSTGAAPTTITVTTSYTTVCPTGYTTITTTYTTTYCPGTGCGTSTLPGVEPTAPPPVLPSSAVTPTFSYPVEPLPTGGNPSTFSASGPATSYPSTSGSGTEPTSPPPPVFTGSASATSFSGKWLVTLAVGVFAFFFGM